MSSSGLIVLSMATKPKDWLTTVYSNVSKRKDRDYQGGQEQQAKEHAPPASLAVVLDRGRPLRELLRYDCRGGLALGLSRRGSFVNLAESAYDPSG